MLRCRHYLAFSAMFDRLIHSFINLGWRIPSRSCPYFARITMPRFDPAFTISPLMTQTKQPIPFSPIHLRNRVSSTYHSITPSFLTSTHSTNQSPFLSLLSSSHPSHPPSTPLKPSHKPPQHPSSSNANSSGTETAVSPPPRLVPHLVARGFASQAFCRVPWTKAWDVDVVDGGGGFACACAWGDGDVACGSGRRWILCLVRWVWAPFFVGDLFLVVRVLGYVRGFLFRWRNWYVYALLCRFSCDREWDWLVLILHCNVRC